MSGSMRRARRTPKRNSDYSVGDIVEIQRHGVVLQGRLAQLLTEGPSPNPRWLLKFDGQPYKDEEMYERSFGKTLYSMSVVDEEGSIGLVPSSASVSSASTQRKVSTVGRGTNGNKKGGTSSDDDETEPKGLFSEDKTGERGSHAGSDVESDTSERRAHNRRRASAREERSRRRQAKIDEEIFPNLTVHEQLLTGAKRRLSSLSASFQHSKRSRRDGHDLHTDGNNDSHDDDKGKNNTVIQVNLLTGTLYLYRGKHRRAEFIRRV